MNLLLDTHAFIWWASAPEMLSAAVLSACQDPRTVLLVSIASAWEMQIKIQLGKLQLATSLEHLFHSQMANRVQLLPIRLDHVLALGQLPQPHKDPFDRIIIAQAVVENVVVASSDGVFTQYPITMLW